VVDYCLSRQFDDTASSSDYISTVSDNVDDIDDVTLVQSTFGDLSNSVVSLDAVINATVVADPVPQRLHHHTVEG
jgi:hypothetical protein